MPSIGDVVATTTGRKSLASLAARRLVRRRTVVREERSAPVYQAMREAFIAGDWKEFRWQGRLLDDLGVPRRPPTYAQQQALHAKLERFLGK